VPRQASIVQLASANLKVPRYIEENNSVRATPAGFLPCMTWPDGSVFHLGNLYLLHCWNKGLGGIDLVSVRTSADLLAPVVRWAFASQSNFYDLTDDKVYELADWLRDEPHPRQPGVKRRSATQTSRIGAKFVDFLRFVDELFTEHKIVAPAGSVQVERRMKSEPRHEGSVSYYYSHPAFPKDGRPRRRKPVSTRAIEAIKLANQASKKSMYIKQRRYAQIRLLCLCGGRLTELHKVDVAHIREAAQSGRLRLYSAKKGRPAEREVPVDEGSIQELLTFIEYHRSRIFVTPGGKVLREDCGRLFVDEQGRALSRATLGKEVSDLRKLAKITDEEVVSHAFRHRYITMRMQQIIREHKIRGKTEFMRLLRSMKSLCVELMEWTGHSSMKALEHYVDWALELDEITFDVQQAMLEGDTAGAYQSAVQEVITLAETGTPEEVVLAVRGLKGVQSALQRAARARRERNEAGKGSEPQ